MDTKPWQRSDLIGEYSIDLLSIFYEPRHELYRRWVALTAPFSARQRGLLRKPAEGGVQGYVRLSLTLLGPGDKPPYHAPGEDHHTANSAILFPPALSLRLNFLVVDVHRAVKLPQMDYTWTGGRPKGGGIDAYVKVQFAGVTIKTKVITDRNPVCHACGFLSPERVDMPPATRHHWSLLATSDARLNYAPHAQAWAQRFLIPILMPSVGQLITITVRDYDFEKRGEIVDVLTIPFDAVPGTPASKTTGMLTRWYHLYGLSAAEERDSSALLASRTKQAELKRFRADYASEWRGKLLLGLNLRGADGKCDTDNRSLKKPLPEKPLTMPIKQEQQADPVANVPYELRASVLLASDAGSAPGINGPVGEVLVEIQIDEYVFRSNASSNPSWTLLRPSKVQNGCLAHFFAEGDAEQPPSLFTAMSSRAFELPKDKGQLPDVMVYLLRPTSDSARPERIAFTRLPARSCMDEDGRGYGFARQWLTLRPVKHETPRRGKPAGEPLPALLIDVHLVCMPPPDAAGRSAGSNAGDLAPLDTSTMDLVRCVREKVSLQPFEVRVHLFQARGLPARDSNGVLDAYVVAKLCGSEALSTFQTETTHPQWYETLKLQVWLPCMQWDHQDQATIQLDMAPHLVLSVWDKDESTTTAGQLTDLLVAHASGGLANFDDDFVGRCRLPLTSALRHNEPALNGKLLEDLYDHATWVPLAARGSNARVEGELLLTVELLNMSAQSEPPHKDVYLPSNIKSGRKVSAVKSSKAAASGSDPDAKLPLLKPLAQDGKEAPSPDLMPEDSSQRYSVKVAVISIRGLRPMPSLDSQLTVFGLRRPFVRVDLGKRKAGRKGGGLASASRRTTTSNKPSVTNPSFMQLLSMDALLPKQPKFLPPINLSVHDSLFGGLHTPLIGATIVELDGRLPSSSAAAEPKGSSVTHAAWENQRWTVFGRKWVACTGTHRAEPPEFSSRKPPFEVVSMEEESAKWDKDAHWAWVAEWQTDLALKDSDKEGWVYASEFVVHDTLCVFGTKGPLSLVRRRKITRTRDYVNRLHHFLEHVQSRKQERQRRQQRPAQTVANFFEAVKVAKEGGSEAEEPSTMAPSSTRRGSWFSSRAQTAPDIEEGLTPLLSSEVTPVAFEQSQRRETLQRRETSQRRGDEAVHSDGDLRVKLLVDEMKGIASTEGSLFATVQWTTSAAQSMVQRRTVRHGASEAVINLAFHFVDVIDPTTEVMLMLYSWRLEDEVYRTCCLGQVCFKLSELELPPTGEAVKKSFPLEAVSSRRAGLSTRAQGTITIQVGWRRRLSDAEGILWIEKLEDQLQHEREKTRRLRADHARAKINTKRGEADRLSKLIEDSNAQMRKLQQHLPFLKAEFEDGATGLSWATVRARPSGTEIISPPLAQALLKEWQRLRYAPSASVGAPTPALAGVAAVETVELSEDAWQQCAESNLRLDSFIQLPNADSSTSLEPPIYLVPRKESSRNDHKTFGTLGEALLRPKYMRWRQEYEEELEGLLHDVPFERFDIMSGQGQRRSKVGTLKAVVRITDPAQSEWSEVDKDLFAQLKAPQEYVVRAYVLRGNNLMALDKGSASDPYLVVKLGNKRIDRRAEHLTDKTTADFFQRFETTAVLPGESLLRVEVWDFDGYGQLSDDLIGATEIDLEDRIFSKVWRNDLGEHTPVERRSIYSPLSKNPQGALDMWVDILTTEQAEKQPAVDIAPPPPQQYELRVVCWSAKDIPEDACDDSGLVDAYVSIQFGKERREVTDTHLRAKDGKASWNWRFKLDLSLDTSAFLSPELLRLSVQVSTPRLEPIDNQPWPPLIVCSRPCVWPAVG